jgi:23S rRNA pseudouridine1911/1915/1917 synthase
MKAAPPILYEDNHLLVVVKPVNIPSQADDSGDRDLLTIIKDDLKGRYQKPGNVYLGLVHRLDRPVGGVMVFAKTSKAAARLSEQIRTREFQKNYLAVIHGSPDGLKHCLQHYLQKDQFNNIVKAFNKPHPEAKEAILEYEVIGRRDNFSLVKIHLTTGRSHQIRVQLAAIGHPLYGDQKYGAGLNKPGQQIALWSAELNFKHPTRDEIMRFKIDPPKVYPWNLFEQTRPST